MALSLLSCASLAAHAETRLALLIGNQSYAAKVGPLKNPRQDVALIEASLKALGFKVTVLNDADYRGMDIALKRYAAELRRAGPGALGFFYYSGHGAANADTQINYLIPVDVASAEDETVWYQSFQQNQIIDLLSKQAANATQFVVFDACRNELNLSGSAAKAIGADKGFVPVANAAGLLIAYATAPNRTASDAGEGGGPYAKALAEELLKPGIEAVTMFRNVQIKVKQTIGQDPWLSFPSLAPVYLAGRQEPTARTPKPQAQVPLSEAAQAWTDIKDSKNPPVFEAFRKQYGQANPLYDALASQRIEELKRAPSEPRTEPEKPNGTQTAIAAPKPAPVQGPSGSWWPWSSGPRTEPEKPSGPQTAILAPKPAPVQAQASPEQLAKLLGKHKLALQWVSWDYFGEAIAAKENGVVTLKGRQNSKTDSDFVTLDGIVSEVDATSFKFVGTIVTRVSYIYGGQPCTREGQFTFKITEKRKYWRLQEMLNPCDGSSTDYVDIFFK
ncbi:MAG: caspase family protein [Rhodomicrobium sp.]